MMWKMDQFLKNQNGNLRKIYIRKILRKDI